MIDVTASQSKQSSELLCPFRQPLLTDSYQGGCVVGHHRHAQLNDGALRPFVTNLSGSACEQTGNGTFHHRAAVAAGTSQLHLVRRSLPVQTGLIEYRKNLLGTGLGIDRLDRLGDADGEHASLMKSLTEDGVIDAEIPGQRMDGWPLWPHKACDSLIDVVEQGQHIAGITGIAHGCTGGKDEACGGLREDAGFATELGWAIALAFHNGGNRGIVGIDDFTVTQTLALGQAARLLADLVMRFDGGAQIACQALLSGGAQMGGLVEGLLCFLRELSDGAADLQELPCGVAYQFHEDLALPPALATKAAHDLLEGVLKLLGLRL